MPEENLNPFINFLTQRNKDLETPTRPPAQSPSESASIFNARNRYIEPSGENARKLLQLTAGLDAGRISTFLTHPYAYESLKFFLDQNQDGSFVISPEKIDMALEVSSKIDTLANIYNYEPQYLGALNIVGYTAVEYIRDHGLNIADTEALLSQLAKLDETESINAAKLEIEKRENRGEIKMRGKSSIVRHLTKYAQEYVPEVQGNFEDYVLKRMAADIHNRLTNLNDELSILEQPQGFEVEVLRHVTQSKKAEERGTKKWLPRGVPWERLERTDWQLIPLLGGGLNEDIGERRYQRFEISTSPSESISAQNTILFALTAAGFISEKDLSQIFEGYSLHVSTVFPKSILSEEAIQDYHRVARSIAGAFASDQRLGFGGFMSGGTEVDDKSHAGTLREVMKIKDVDPEVNGTIPPGYSLIEIRNLDLTPGSHYSALHTKQQMDFAFKCFWKSRSDRSVAMSPFEKQAAKIYENYQRELGAVFAKYGISDTSEHAWKELSRANEYYPEFRATLQKLLRSTTQELRGAFRKNKEEENTKRFLSRPHVVLLEPMGKLDNRWYAPEIYRKKLGLKPGDRIRVSWKGNEIDLTVAQAKKRGNNEIDENQRYRFSENVIRELNIPLATSVIATFDKDIRMLKLKPHEKYADLIVHTHQKRQLLVEPVGQQSNRVYLTATDRERFGVKPGDEVTLRFGQSTQRVVVAQAKIRPEMNRPETPDSGKWRLSANLFTDLHIPEGIQLRSKYDKEKKELSFGPIIGVLNDDTRPQRTLFGFRTKMLKQLQKAAEDIGGVVVIFNPRDIQNQKLENGLVAGYIADGLGGFKRVTMPFPEVIYDRDVNWWATARTERFEMKLEQSTGNKPDIKYVYPPQMQDVTADKELLQNVLAQDEYLRAFLPDTEELTSVENLTQFLNRHKRIFLKPKDGQQGVGLIKAIKNGNLIEFEYPQKEGEEWKLVRQSASSVTELYTLLIRLQKGHSAYLMQEYLDIVEIEIETPKDLPGRNKRMVELRTVVQRGADRRAGIIGVVARLPDKALIGHEYEMNGLSALYSAFPKEKADLLFAQAKKISIAAQRRIEQYLNLPSGEITIDIAVTTDGRLYILEGNSKAETRGMFERIGNEDAALGSVTNPMQYAASIAGYT